MRCGRARQPAAACLRPRRPAPWTPTCTETTWWTRARVRAGEGGRGRRALGRAGGGAGLGRRRPGRGGSTLACPPGPSPALILLPLLPLVLNPPSSHERRLFCHKRPHPVPGQGGGQGQGLGAPRAPAPLRPPRPLAGAPAAGGTAGQPRVPGSWPGGWPAGPLAALPKPRHVPARAVCPAPGATGRRRVAQCPLPSQRRRPQPRGFTQPTNTPPLPSLQPKVYNYYSTVQHSGVEDLTMQFAWGAWGLAWVCAAGLGAGGGSGARAAAAGGRAGLRDLVLGARRHRALLSFTRLAYRCVAVPRPTLQTCTRSTSRRAATTRLSCSQ